MHLLVLPGDGIGPEISAATLQVLNHANQCFGLDLTIEVGAIGLEALAAQGTTFPDEVRAKAHAADGIVLAPLSTYQYPPASEGGINPSAELRLGLDLFANLRPCKTRVRTDARAKTMDLIIVRENTEGFYASRSMFQGQGEFMPDPRTAFALRKITESASRAIAVAAFELAAARHQNVTVVHKANVLKLTDGLFLSVVRDVASNYPSVSLSELLVDAAAALMIRAPDQFDVVLTTNMFGDILSNEAAELAGGLGLAPSLNAGGDRAMAQAAHGSGPDIAGRNIANPTGLLLSTAMLLEWLGRKHSRFDLRAASEAMTEAVEECLAAPGARTRDLNGNLSTSDFAQAVIDRFRADDATQRARRRA